MPFLIYLLTFITLTLMWKKTLAKEIYHYLNSDDVAILPPVRLEARPSTPPIHYIAKVKTITFHTPFFLKEISDGFYKKDL